MMTKNEGIIYAMYKSTYLLIHLIGRLVKLTPEFSVSILNQLISETFKLLVDVFNYFLLQKNKFFIQQQVIVIVLVLPGQFKLSILILGKPGTCAKYGLFQCDNGRCSNKFWVCNGIDNCGDNTDESKTHGAFCGMCP